MGVFIVILMLNSHIYWGEDHQFHYRPSDNTKDIETPSDLLTSAKRSLLDV